MSNKNSKDSQKYPIELPSRNNGLEHSPIVDVVESETFPFDVNSRHHSGVQVEAYSNISEVVTAEVEPGQSSK